MKKILVTILTVAMMTSAVAAFADGGPQGGPMGGPMGGPPRMEQGQQAPEKPDAAPEKPTGEKPADAPEEPEDLTGERPEMSSGEQRQAPTGEKPADAPEMPSGEQGQAPQGQAPQGHAPTSQQPTDSQQAPKMIDFDAMVASGVISQETRDDIKAYMDEHKPEGEMPGAPGEGETPAEGEPSLLNDLLNAGIITQTEYDAMSAAA